MRGLIASVGLLCCVLVVRGQAPPASVMLREGGFAPSGANFRVTFGFSDMAAVVKPAKETPRVLTSPGWAQSAFTWSSAQGATARLEVCCGEHTMGWGDGTLAAARLWVTNPSDRPFRTSVVVAMAPEGRIPALAFERHAFLVEGRLVLIADTPSRGAILAESPFAARPLTAQDQGHVESVEGACRGEMFFDLTLAPGQTQTLGFICPVRLPPGSKPTLEFYRQLSVEELCAQAQTDSAGR